MHSFPTKPAGIQDIYKRTTLTTHPPHRLVPQLIHLDRVHAPEALRKRGRVVRDPLLAAAGARGAAAAGPHAAGPVAAERRVEDDAHVAHVVVERAPGAGVERHDGQAPARGVGPAGGDVGGHGAAREEPHVDARFLPLHGVDAAAAGVEAGSEGAGAGGAHGAAQGAAEGVAVVAEAGGGALGAAGVDGAAGAGVQGHGVCGLLVGALEDVDLARVGPVGAEHPEGGPGAAGRGGHVRDVGDEEAVRVGGLGGEAHRGPALGGDVGVVDVHEDLGVGGGGEAAGGGVVGGEVGDEAVGGVWVGEVVEGGEEVGGVVVVDQGVMAAAVGLATGGELICVWVVVPVLRGEGEGGGGGGEEGES